MVFISGQVARVAGKQPTPPRPDGWEKKKPKRAPHLHLAGFGLAESNHGDLDRVERVIKVTGFVNSAPDFGGQPQIIDAAPTMLGDIFKEAGLHARAAVGMAALPGQAPVEIEFIFGIRA
jgi:enamine deaminase RidA (YjgF/YER057c/UK114 family)